MPDNVLDRFTTHLKNVLTRALCLAVEEGKRRVTPEHLFWSLATQKGCLAAEVLRKHHVKLTSVRQLIDTAPILHSVETTPELSEDTRKIIEQAVLVAHTHEHRYVGTEHLLAAIMCTKNQTLIEFFRREKIDLNEITEQVEMVLHGTSRFPEMETILEEQSSTSTKTLQPIETLAETEEKESEEKEEIPKPKTPALDYFTRDLTSRAAADKIDPVIGRDLEIRRVMEILCRRLKNNPILLGEPGVGKTAIVEGLAKRIAEGLAPQPLARKRILALDLAAVVAGTMYRGEFEGRMKQIIEEVRQNPDVILFVDEAHTIMGAGSASGSLDAANMLKPALARGEIHCIGATTLAEYKKQFETDAALERRFQPVRVEEPSAALAKQILRGLAPSYEAYHNVTVEPDALDAAVDYSVRYITDRRLPDKAIDLLDEAAAALRINEAERHAPSIDIRMIEDELKNTEEQKKRAVLEDRLDDALTLKNAAVDLRRRIAEISASQIVPFNGRITREHIAGIVSRTTGIPVATQEEEEKQRLRSLASTLENIVLGQTEATTTVAAALLRAKAGIAHPDRPLASFLFVGPSGVGKSELAHAIAETLFQDRRALLALNMSEYNEAYSVSKLVGAPAGYVGYREGAKLTDHVKHHPHTVILLDEIEKAHRDVHHLLLQILETGEMADATGHTVNFRQTIIVLTSNIGAERFRGTNMGFGGDATAPLRENIRSDLEEAFRPELLNRLDHTLIFHPLAAETLTSIAKKHLDEVMKRVAGENVACTYHVELPKHIAAVAEDTKIGARAIRQWIQREIEAPLAAKLLAKRKPKTLNISLEKKHIRILGT